MINEAVDPTPTAASSCQRQVRKTLPYRSLPGAGTRRIGDFFLTVTLASRSDPVSFSIRGESLSGVRKLDEQLLILRSPFSPW